MTMRMTLPDAQTRAAIIATGMERGMEASYVRLAALLTNLCLARENQTWQARETQVGE